VSELSRLGGVEDPDPEASSSPSDSEAQTPPCVGAAPIEGRNRRMMQELKACLNYWTEHNLSYLKAVRERYPAEIARERESGMTTR